MLNRTVLEQAGIDVDEALGRVMGNEMLLNRLLDMFLDDAQHAGLHSAIEAHDQDAAIAAVHSLKGTSGNLSIKPLFELTNQQLALFREGNWDDAVALLPEIDAAYASAIEAIGARGN